MLTGQLTDTLELIVIRNAINAPVNIYIRWLGHNEQGMITFSNDSRAEQE